MISGRHGVQRREIRDRKINMKAISISLVYTAIGLGEITKGNNVDIERRGLRSGPCTCQHGDTRPRRKSKQRNKEWTVK